MTKNEILALAEKGLTSSLVGYEGDKRGGYVGQYDLGLSFMGGASSFVDETKNGIQYAINISNMGTAAVDRVLALHPGFLTTAAEITNAAGIPAAAIVTDGSVISTVDAVVVCSGKPKPIKQLQAFVNRNPTRFTGLKMLVNNSDQFEEELYIKKLSPFKNMEDLTINPSAFKNSNQTDDKRVEIPLEDFQLDDQTVVVFTLKAGRQVTFTFFAGAIANQAGELNAKAVLARSNMTRTY
jgi:Tfp pilus assembly protein PilP